MEDEQIKTDETKTNTTETKPETVPYQEVEKLNEQVELLKKQISGETRKNAEYQKIVKEKEDALEAERLAKLNEKERLLENEKKAVQRQKEYEEKIRNLELKEFKKDKIAESGLDYQASRFVSGATELEISENIEALKEYIRIKIEEVKKSTDEEWRSKAGKPSSGTTNPSTGGDYLNMSFGQAQEYSKKATTPEQAKAIMDAWFNHNKKR